MISPTFFTYGDDGWEVSETIWVVTVAPTLIFLILYQLFVEGQEHDLSYGGDYYYLIYISKY